jgi:predicted RNA binding protein YcfA (HicA-like mRNA interferase family)
MSPKIPRDVSANDLIKLLSKFGYVVSRQKGSHIRLSISSTNGEYHITIPNHNPIKLGTLSSIISDVAEQLDISKEEILKKL